MVERAEPADAGLSIEQGEWHGETARFVARRVIVKLRAPTEEAPAAAAAALESAAAQVTDAVPDGHVLRSPTPTGRVVLEVGPDADVLEVAGELDDRDDVEYAEPDLVDRAAVVPNDARVGDQWALAAVNAFDAWDLEQGSPDVVVGIIDSGISMTGTTLDHPDLNDAGRVVLGTDYVDGGTPRDTNGHGTHVAGIAAAAGNNAVGIAGMNWGSRLYICRTLDANGNGSTADFADAVEEIVDYALANGLRAVINYSAGGGDNQTRRAACEYASNNGMLLCAATGNDNAGPVIFPAAYSTSITGVVAVGSTDQGGGVSSFSNVGPEVTVVAPGRGILSTMPTYPVTSAAGTNFGFMNGTSMATPLVTGLAALMWSRHPTFTHEKIKDCLRSTAVKLGAGDFNDAWGHGLVDAAAAVRCGDVVLPPTIIGPRCPDTLVPHRCPSVPRTSCPTSVIQHQCPSRPLVSCPPSRPPETCPSVLEVRCPSRPPVLCPTSRVPVECPSRPPVLCPTTRLPDACPQPSLVRVTCPSVVAHQCPSAVAVTCPVPSRLVCEPLEPFQPPVFPRGPVAEERWYGETGDYYWLDEHGRANPWSPAEGEAAATQHGADYYWIDDAGQVHYWSPGGGG